MNLANTYPGTQELVETIIAESKNHPAWRPTRAGAIMALAEAEERAWMTAGEFADWFEVNSWAARRRKEGITPTVAVGIGPAPKLKIIRGERSVSKVEALACAHYAMRFTPPVEAGDVAGFARWCEKTFGGTAALAEWLGIRPEYITDRIRGFDVLKGERLPRAPDITLIRAMDWVARCGPFCPYGERLPVKTWPGQEA